MIYHDCLRSRGVPVVLCAAVLQLFANRALAEEPEPCATLDSCLAVLVQGPRCPYGCISRDLLLAKRVIRAFDGRAIGPLMRLLKNPDYEVRNRAAFLLSDIEGLGEQHLTDLIAARNAGVSWVLPSIARVGSDRAIRFLLNGLRQELSLDHERARAFSILGSKVVPHLVAIIGCRANCVASALWMAAMALGVINESAGQAVEPLRRIALDVSFPKVARENAVEALGLIGSAAQPTASDLAELARRDSTFAAVVERALRNIGDPLAAPYFIGLQRRERGVPEKIFALRELAIIGPAGRAEGDQVLPFLTSQGEAQPRASRDTWDLRVAAAQTLGWIGYSEAVPALRQALTYPFDWRLNLVAAEALRRLCASDAARAELQKVAAGHWYPPVRDAARNALAAVPPAQCKIRDPLVEPSRFFAYEHAGRAIKHCAPDGSCPRALDVPGGRIEAQDRGEFGGGVEFVGDDGRRARLIEEPTHALHRLGGTIVAIAGLAHLSLNHGAVFELVPVRKGVWTARKRVILPGAPRNTRVLRTGDIAIDTEGGKVNLDPSFSLRLVKCQTDDEPL